MFPLWGLHICFWVVPINPPLITSDQCSGIWGHCLLCPACPVRFPKGVASVPSLAASERILQTLIQAQILSQNWVYRSSAYPHLDCKFLDCDTMVLHDQSPHLINDIVISARSGPTGTRFAVHRCAPIFEAAEALLYAWFAHGIVSESLLDLVNGFHLGIAKLLAEFDAISLLKSFRHFATIDNPTSGHYTSSLIGRLVTGWHFLWAGKNLGMHMNVPYTTPLKDASQSSFVYAGKIKVRYFLNSGLELKLNQIM
jgi:hypothetical protein